MDPPMTKETTKLLEDTKFKMLPPASVVDEIFSAESSSMIGGTDLIMTPPPSSNELICIVFKDLALLNNETSSTRIVILSLLDPPETAPGS